MAYLKSRLARRRSQPELLQSAGTLDAKSIREMREAIEDDCETVDKNELIDANIVIGLLQVSLQL